MKIKRKLFSGKIKEIEGKKVERGLFSGRVKKVGDEKVKYNRHGEVKSVGGQKVKHSSGKVKKAPDNYYCVDFILRDDSE